MIINSILLIFASDNDDLSEKNKIFQGNCFCDKCFCKYIQHIEERTEEYSSFLVELVEEDNVRQNQANENCLRRLIRSFLAIFSYGTYILQSTDEPKTVSESQRDMRHDKTKENESSVKE